MGTSISPVFFSTYIKHFFLFQDLLRKIRDEAISLTQMRQLTLESSVRFYRFKSELLFLDQWIQEQIAHIKTDGIGNCTVDCRALLKETEDFAKNLIAKEERIANFGILSQEITERHPASAKVSLVSVCFSGVVKVQLQVYNAVLLLLFVVLNITTSGSCL